MHCYALNFEEVEGANWFGPVRLSVLLPSPTPPQKMFLSRFCLFVKKNTNSSPLPRTSLPFPTPTSKKDRFEIWIRSKKITYSCPLSSHPNPPKQPPTPRNIFFSFRFLFFV